MPSVEILLTVFTISFLFGVPIYTLFRKRMTRKVRTRKVVRNEIWRVTILILFLTISVACIFFLLLFSIYSRDKSVLDTNIILVLAFIICVLAALFGAGIYVTSIVLEYYTIDGLRDEKEFNTQFYATHLFHGPVSHLLIYQGMLWSVFFLSLIDILHSGDNLLILSPYLLVFMGIVAGVLFCVSQITNGTEPYHIVPIFLAFVFYVFIIIILQLSLENAPLGLFFAGMITSSVVFFVIYCVYLLLDKKRTVNWNGGILKIS